VASEDGALDGAAWTLLAEVRFRLGDVEGALAAADRAHSNADTDQELELAAGFSAWLQTNFGVLTARTRFDGVRSSIRVELLSLVLDPEQKTYIAEIDARLSELQTLPVRFGLPVGTYRVNGREVRVDAGSRSTVRVPVRDAPPEPLQVTELEVSGGLSVVFGADAEGSFPGPYARFGVSQPVGALVFGLAADWSPRPHERPTGLHLAVGEVGLGLRGGIEAARIRDAAVRAELSGRVVRTAARGLPCEVDGDTWTCNSQGRAMGWLAPPALAFAPGLEVSAVAVDRRKTPALGWGVRAVGELVTGRRVASGTGQLDGDPFTYAVNDDDRTVLMGGVRLLVTVVWAR
jgi:hypothetical protein